MRSVPREDSSAPTLPLVAVPRKQLRLHLLSPQLKPSPGKLQPRQPGTISDAPTADCEARSVMSFGVPE